MEQIFQNYGALIEKIRKDRLISRDELCEDIMSKRNYQRFTSGDVSVSSDKILKMIDKLRIDYFTLQDIYKAFSQDEYMKLIKAFNHTVKWEYDKAKVILTTIDSENITSEFNKQMFNYINLLVLRKNGNIGETEFYSKVEKIIDFPNILKKKILNIEELNALFSLTPKYIARKDPKITNYFLDLIKNQEEYSYWLSSDYMASIFANVTKGIYQLEQYEECIEFCNSGIEFCRFSERFSGLSNLLGYKSMALNKIGKRDEAISAAISLYMQLLLENNQEKTTMYMNIVNKSLNIDISSLINIKKEAI